MNVHFNYINSSAVMRSSLLSVQNSLLTETQREFKYILDVHGSVLHNINLIEVTSKMRPCSRIYYSNVS